MQSTPSADTAAVVSARAMLEARTTASLVGVPGRLRRVGIVAENYFPTLGGIQEHIRHLRNFLVDRGIDVTIITGTPQVKGHAPVPADADRNVVRVGPAMQYGIGGSFTQATFGPNVARRFARLLREKQFDVLNIHGPCDPGLPTLARLLYRGPQVQTLHSCFPHAKWRTIVAPYYRWVLRKSAGVIAVSEATRDAMGRYARFDAQLVPNGVDCDYWAKGRKSDAFGAWSGRTLVYLGRLEARNGFDLLLDAFVRLAEKRPDVRLLVAGDGPERTRYESEVPPALREKVKFLGALYDERPDLFASADMMVLPARAVGFSILVLEAFAAGLPVVALPCIGVGRAGDHWKNVMLAREPNAASLAAAVDEALDADPTAREARVQAGRAIATSYDWTRIGPQILDVLENAVRVGARAHA